MAGWSARTENKNVSREPLASRREKGEYVGESEDLTSPRYECMFDVNG